MRAIRVDGNDLLAVLAATIEARRIAVENSCPVLIEAMSYRRGHHSTSDDSTRYRSVAEIKFWQDNLDPLKRFRNYLKDQGWWNDEMEQKCRDSERINVLSVLSIAEKRPKPKVNELFDDVYETIPSHLQKQKAEMLEALARHPELYDPNVNTH